MLCVFLACHNLSQLSETYKKLKPSNSFSKCGNLDQMPMCIIIFDILQEPGIKAHMLNRVSFHPITRAKRPQAF